MLNIEPKGIEEFKALRDLIQLFFDNTMEFSAYLSIAQKRITQGDLSLYPTE